MRGVSVRQRYGISRRFTRNPMLDPIIGMRAIRSRSGLRTPTGTVVEPFEPPKRGDVAPLGTGQPGGGISSPQERFDSLMQAGKVRKDPLSLTPSFDSYFGREVGPKPMEVTMGMLSPGYALAKTATYGIAAGRAKKRLSDIYGPNISDPFAAAFADYIDPNRTEEATNLGKVTQAARKESTITGALKSAARGLIDTIRGIGGEPKTNIGGGEPTTPDEPKDMFSDFDNLAGGWEFGTSDFQNEDRNGPGGSGGGFGGGLGGFGAGDFGPGGGSGIGDFGFA